MGLIEPVDLSRQPERHCLHSSGQLPYLESEHISVVKVGPLTNLVPPPAAFINHSSTSSVTCLFVWVLTELQPAAALGSGI